MLSLRDRESSRLPLLESNGTGRMAIISNLRSASSGFWLLIWYWRSDMWATKELTYRYGGCNSTEHRQAREPFRLEGRIRTLPEYLGSRAVVHPRITASVQLSSIAFPTG